MHAASRKSNRKSGLCIALWSGETSRGQSYEYAQRSDGAFFYHEYRNNRYGGGWSRWQPCPDPRDHGTERIGGGFARDPQRTTEKLGRLRLPAA